MGCWCLYGGSPAGPWVRWPAPLSTTSCWRWMLINSVGYALLFWLFGCGRETQDRRKPVERGRGKEREVQHEQFDKEYIRKEIGHHMDDHRSPDQVPVVSFGKQADDHDAFQ